VEGICSYDTEEEDFFFYTVNLFSFELEF